MQQKKRICRKKGLFFCLGIVGLLLIIGDAVYAAEGKIDRSIYEIGKYHIDTFASYLSDSEFSLGKMLFGGNGTDFLKMITNMFFGLSKLIWQGLDFVIQKLYEGAAMDQLIHKFFTFSDTIYSKIFDPIGAAVVASYFAYIFVLRLFKGKRHAQMVLLRFLFILVFSMMWFGFGNHVPSKGEAFTKGLNEVSTEVEGFVFSATNSLDELASKDVGAISVPTTQEASIQKVRQLYYKAAVVDPYLLLNYGTTDLQELTNAGIEPTEFLSKNASNDSLSEIESKVTDAAGNDEKKETYRAYIQPTKAVYKAMVGSLVPLLNLSIGLPLAVIGMIRFIFQMLVLCVLMVIPFSLVASFVPSFDYMLMNTLKSLIGMMFQKSFYSVIILVAFLIYNVVDDLIPMNTVFGFLGNMFVKAILSLLVVVKRKDLMKKLGLGAANRTLSTTKNIANHSLSQVRQLPGQLAMTSQNFAIKGAGLAGNVYRATNPMAAAALHGFQKFQQNRTPQEPKKGGQVINPLKLEGRSKQGLPYGGHQVRYHGMDPETSPMSPKNEVRSGLSGGFISGSSMDPAGPKQQVQSLEQSSKNPGVNQRKPLLNKGIDFVGQTIPLPSGKTPVPQLIANGSLSQQVRQVKNQAKNGVYPALQQLTNQTSLPTALIPTLPRNRSTQRKVEQPSEKAVGISVSKIPQSSLPFSNKQGEPSEKIGKKTSSLPILEAKQGTDFILPKGRTAQKPLSKKG
ncbi:CD3337/EF1877 family mobilome membrane protein [Enterococcus faecium]|uniref:Uncharacterized protein n=1 Tax=Enterococcus faecium TaxID=1352 RepID=A0A242B0C9_ENTFC|nr:hypothetical protein [Enterococcus faecium]OTN86782.1 hypothetical protein A5810_002905 [Enterococcus faecium]OTN86805.1 hypothetical protein A5810_002875 [Enterococcus faecium]